MTVATLPAAVTFASPSAPDRPVFLLGPQRIKTTLGRVLKDAGIDGDIASVTAGWQEREDEVEELQAQLRGRGVSLRLHSRGDEVFREDRDLAKVHHERQVVLQTMQRTYDVRLRHTMAAIAELERRPGPAEILAADREDAMQALRDLDARHLERVQAIHEEWAPRLRLGERPAVQRHRKELEKTLAGVSALAISGGHVAVLLNRLRLFDVLGSLPAGVPVVGWSGGAIVLTERVVFYHDSPPQGPGNAEVFEIGLGVARNVVALPHATRRLSLDDTERVSRFARRFAPAASVVLDDGGVLSIDGDRWTADAAIRRLEADGTVKGMSR
ncbi:MAG: Type 1 glutamine amidotransferase-like domain-containing protein [Gemmatimonadetes bacterium]|nr:Type 1 glutamine amidotransferase-like domain-containing protein [Gemmatimonadota bacterium]